MTTDSRPTAEHGETRYGTPYESTGLSWFLMALAEAPLWGPTSAERPVIRMFRRTRRLWIAATVELFGAAPQVRVRTVARDERTGMADMSRETVKTIRRELTAAQREGFARRLAAMLELDPTDCADCRSLNDVWSELVEVVGAGEYRAFAARGPAPRTAVLRSLLAELVGLAALHPLVALEARDPDSPRLERELEAPYGTPYDSTFLYLFLLATRERPLWGPTSGERATVRLFRYLSGVWFVVVVELHGDGGRYRVKSVAEVSRTEPDVSGESLVEHAGALTYEQGRRFAAHITAALAVDPRTSPDCSSIRKWWDIMVEIEHAGAYNAMAFRRDRPHAPALRALVDDLLALSRLHPVLAGMMRTS